MPDQNFTDKIANYISAARLRASDGLTIAELATLTVDAMRLAIELLDHMQLPGTAKKHEVLRIVGFFFDEFADACIPAVAKPVWWVFRSAVRSLVMSLADGAVESILPLVRGAE